MKKFEHKWDDDIFLLHLELQLVEKANNIIYIMRHFNDGLEIPEDRTFMPGTDGFRFILSRTMPSEYKVEVSYSDDIVLKAYSILDRAYYPTQYFYVC